MNCLFTSEATPYLKVSIDFITQMESRFAVLVIRLKLRLTYVSYWNGIQFFMDGGFMTLRRQTCVRTVKIAKQIMTVLTVVGKVVSLNPPP